MRFEKPEEVEKREVIGQGTHKVVYQDPVNPERVISFHRHYEDRPRNLKARYYLTKIGSLLLPNMIPKIHQAIATPDKKEIIDSQKIPHSQEHQDIMRAHKDRFSSDFFTKNIQEQDQIIAEVKRAEGKLWEKTNGKLGEVYHAIKDSGLASRLDAGEQNFINTENGDVFYIETLEPWLIYPDFKSEGRKPNLSDLAPNAKGSKLFLVFNPEKLKAAINALKNADDRITAQHLLERLLELAREEAKEKGLEIALD